MERAGREECPERSGKIVLGNCRDPLKMKTHSGAKRQAARNRKAPFAAPGFGGKVNLPKRRAMRFRCEGRWLFRCGRRILPLVFLSAPSLFISLGSIYAVFVKVEKASKKVDGGGGLG